MAYVTTQDLIDRLGADEVHVLADRDRDGELDDAAIEDAAADAAAEIDAYLGARYPVPLADPLPRVIARIAIDITVYRLADIGGVGGTDARRQRYEDAISLLKRIASGEVSLGVGGTDGNGAADDGTPEIVGAQILDDHSPERLFGRRKQSGWPV
ncbi:gp436 family protein [Salinisphaera orenii]|uniref:gp436 family protein n=1 Tax=Salinisphaera orenii TaxID=856731 RepID=UPI000DBE04BD